MGLSTRAPPRGEAVRVFGWRRAIRGKGVRRAARRRRAGSGVNASFKEGALRARSRRHCQQQPLSRPRNFWTQGPLFRPLADTSPAQGR